jgi:acylphosphatase
MDHELKHIKLTVAGRVQGVWFRASTKEQADNLGVHGFVRNLLNGNVYIEAEGTEEQLQRFVNWCKIGPRLAHVDEVVEEHGNPAHFTCFEIR